MSLRRRRGPPSGKAAVQTRLPVRGLVSEPVAGRGPVPPGRPV